MKYEVFFHTIKKSIDMKKTITTIAILVIMTISSAFANISGIYYGEYDGSKIACQVEQQGDELAGVIQDAEGNVYVFQNQIVGGKTKGTMTVNGMYEFPYSASFTGSSCKINISGNGNSLALNLSKAQTTSTTSYSKPAPTSKPAGNLDASVIGRWMMESSVSSGGGFGDYASMTSVTYYQYNADGTYSMTDGGAAGSGADWSYSSGASNSATTGKWYVKDGNLYYSRNGNWYYKKYTMHKGQLVFGTGNDHTFLSRVN
mgnify:CR=1 FL=1